MYKSKPATHDTQIHCRVSVKGCKYLEHSKTWRKVTCYITRYFRNYQTLPICCVLHSPLLLNQQGILPIFTAYSSTNDINTVIWDRHFPLLLPQAETVKNV